MNPQPNASSLLSLWVYSVNSWIWICCSSVCFIFYSTYFLDQTTKKQLLFLFSPQNRNDFQWTAAGWILVPIHRRAPWADDNGRRSLTPLPRAKSLISTRSTSIESKDAFTPPPPVGRWEWEHKDLHGRWRLNEFQGILKRHRVRGSGNHVVSCDRPPSSGCRAAIGRLPPITDGDRGWRHTAHQLPLQWVENTSDGLDVQKVSAKHCERDMRLNWYYKKTFFY